MAIRNFYVKGNIDGRAAQLTGGPASKTGGLDLTIYQRCAGAVTTAIRVSCYEDNGVLVTSVFDNTGRCLGTYVTQR
jgi:hypothetical protein